MFNINAVIKQLHTKSEKSYIILINKMIGCLIVNKLQQLKDTVKKILIKLTKMPNPVRTVLILSGLFTTISCKIYIWTIGCINNNSSWRKWHFPYTDFV